MTQWTRALHSDPLLSLGLSDSTPERSHRKAGILSWVRRVRRSVDRSIDEPARTLLIAQASAHICDPAHVELDVVDVPNRVYACTPTH